MILEALWNRSVLLVIREFIKAGDYAILSAREISRRTGLSTPTVIEATNVLIALGILEKVKVTEKREYFKLRELNVFTPYIEDLMRIGEMFEDFLEENILRHIDDILRENYYIGMYWAAMVDIEPIDYSPNIFAIFTDKPKWILPLKFSDKIYVEEIDKWNPKGGKSAYIAIGKLDDFIDVRFGNVKGFKVRVTSVEKGIAQLFKWRIYPEYASVLAILQNIEMDRLNEEKLLNIAKDLGGEEIIRAIAFSIEKILGKKIFSILSQGLKEEKRKPDIVWGEKQDLLVRVNQKIVGLDSRPIREAIITVYG